MSSVSLCHHSLAVTISFHDKGFSNCSFAENNIRAFHLALGIAAGMQRISCGKSLPNLEGGDGLPYVVLRNLSDGTWQKTMSQTELEHGEQYSRVTEKSQAK